MKENDINFIKWMCEKAGWECRIYDGWGIFSYLNHTAVFHEDKETRNSDTTNLLMEMLSQKAIEGVNMEEPDVGIIITLCLVEVVHYRDFSNAIKSWNYIDREIGIDDAKESALRYIYEQERKE